MMKVEGEEQRHVDATRRDVVVPKAMPELRLCRASRHDGMWRFSKVITPTQNSRFRIDMQVAVKIDERSTA